MFANWGPACRVLVQNVSEWFSLFFLFYRPACIGHSSLTVAIWEGDGTISQLEKFDVWRLYDVFSSAIFGVH